MAVTINGSTGVDYADNIKQKFGTGDDLEIFHDGSYSKIKTSGSSHLFIQADYDANNWLYLDAGHSIELRTTNYDKAIVCNSNSSVDLYYNNDKRLSTWSDGVNIYGDEGESAILHLYADDGDDNADKWRLVGGHDGIFYLQNYAQGQWEDNIKAQGDGYVKLYYDNSKKFETTGTGTDLRGTLHKVEGVLRPYNDNTWDIGTTSDRWDDIYATNGTIQTSDKNEKNTIVDTDLGLSFVNKLKPVSYKFNGKTRTHYGLIAQDVETTLSDISKPTTGFAGFIKEDIPDKLYVEDDEIPEGKKVGDLKTAAYTTYGLRYNEFISPLIKAVQELSAEVETLKTKVAALEAHTHE